MTRFSRAAVVVALTAAGCLGTGLRAEAVTPQPGTPPGPQPAPSVTIAPAVGATRLTPEQLKAQIAQADRLRQGLLHSTDQIAAATSALQRLTDTANTVLQQYSDARDAEQAATAEANANRARSARLGQQLTAAKAQLSSWAFHAYTSGGSFAEAASLLDAMAKDAVKAGDSAGDLGYLSDQRVRGLQRVREVSKQQHGLTVRAIAANARATAATEQAAAARARLDEVIGQQRTELDDLRRLHSAQLAKATPVSGLLLGNGGKDALAALAALQEALRKTGATVVDAVGKACSNDDAGYPNGRIPSSALCPLLGAPEQSLRPAAAAAFNALSAAYVRDTGTPLCVTDSYRSLPEQVLVKAERGSWAAAPGTSKHGLGLAVDLCGGVDSFGTPAQLWMRQNAPSYGWFHPSWAGAGGSLPEPWHWEYAGA